MKLIVGKNIPNPPENLSDEDILRVAEDGNRIQAIKWYRILHSVSLKDAKDAVENMILESKK